MKKENIQRFKEGLLILCFLLFLFSFSDKGFGSTLKNEKVPVTIENLTHFVSVTLPGALVPAKQFPARVTFPLNFGDTDLKDRLDSYKSTILFSAAEKKFLCFKPQITSVFYYRLHTLSEDIPALF